MTTENTNPAAPGTADSTPKLSGFFADGYFIPEQIEAIRQLRDVPLVMGMIPIGGPNDGRQTYWGARVDGQLLDQDELNGKGPEDLAKRNQGLAEKVNALLAAVKTVGVSKTSLGKGSLQHKSSEEFTLARAWTSDTDNGVLVGLAYYRPITGLNGVDGGVHFEAGLVPTETWTQIRNGVVSNSDTLVEMTYDLYNSRIRDLSEHAATCLALGPLNASECAVFTSNGVVPAQKVRIDPEHKSVDIWSGMGCILAPNSSMSSGSEEPARAPSLGLWTRVISYVSEKAQDVKEYLRDHPRAVKAFGALLLTGALVNYGMRNEAFQGYVRNMFSPQEQETSQGSDAERTKQPSDQAPPETPAPPAPQPPAPVRVETPAPAWTASFNTLYIFNDNRIEFAVPPTSGATSVAYVASGANLVQENLELTYRVMEGVRRDANQPAPDAFYLRDLTVQMATDGNMDLAESALVLIARRETTGNRPYRFTEKGIEFPEAGGRTPRTVTLSTRNRDEVKELVEQALALAAHYAIVNHQPAPSAAQYALVVESMRNPNGIVTQISGREYVRRFAAQFPPR